MSEFSFGMVLALFLTSLLLILRFGLKRYIDESVSRWRTISQQELLELQSVSLELVKKRNNSYEELWDLIGDICPPRLIGGTLEKENALFPKDIRRIADHVDKWYRQHGAYMDRVSRFWIIFLREECYSWALSPINNDEPFLWKDPKARRTWIVKTALRISINTKVAAPTIEKPLSYKDAWISMSPDIEIQLIRNHAVVRRAWETVRHLSLPTEEEVKGEINELLTIGAVGTTQ